MSEVADNLAPRRGMVKPATALGLGPSSVRGYDELARRTGGVSLSPDPYSYDFSACLSLITDVSVCAAMCAWT
jgi:hypothetical protein